LRSTFNADLGTIDEIKIPVKGEMEEFEKIFRKALSSKVAMLDHITHYLVRRKGKQLRPMLVFLTAKLHGSINGTSHRGAAFIEMIHTATLVHDDVVDDANMRRGFFSLNALWKNKIAVLVGDYLLAKGQLLVIDNGEYEILGLVSEAVRQMSEGELLQIEKARRLDVDETVYYQIIEQKTASLIASCCAVGAASVGASKDQIDQMRKFGSLLGMAFQIKDDLFDYQVVNKSGKPSGIDIKEQKMTLPLIYALSKANRSDKKRIISTVKNHHDNPKRVAEVVEYVNSSGGIEYAEKVMYSYRDSALEILKGFEDSEVKESLKKLANYIIERSK
jgi:octaprenyl-diphosphate synthase